MEFVVDRGNGVILRFATVNGYIVSMDPVEDPWETSCGVVLIHYGGRLVGSLPDLKFEGLKECVFVDADKYCEVYLLQFLESKGVDISMVRGIFFKAPDVGFHELKKVVGDEGFGEICDIIKKYAGVHIYVQHEVDFAFQIEDPLYIGWSEDLNVFGVGGEVDGDREGSVCSWEDFTAGGQKIKFEKNDDKRVRCKCRKGCPWLILFSPDNRTRCWRVKNYNWEHNCLKVYRNRRATADYIAEMFFDRVRDDPSFTAKEMMIATFKEKSLAVRYSKCARAKNKILNDLEGNFKDEYGKLQGYANYLKSCNPNNTIEVVYSFKTRMRDSPRVFERLYVCLDVLKDGWKKGCRRVVGVDGTWLKGVCKGVLLTAVGKDGNGQMYPIAWAVVDIESYDTYKWFFTLLKNDLDLGDGDNLTILSDKHKGLLSSREQLLPLAEHRYCSRHLCANLREFFGTRDLSNIFWCCAKSYDERQWKKFMRLLRTKSVQAHDALLGHDVTRWSRAFLDSTTTCEDVTNNITETFNGWIRNERCLPIISMCEAISDRIMERRAEFYNKMLKWSVDIAPYPFERLKRRIEDVKNCRIVWDGHNSFRVKDSKYKATHVVDSNKKTCTCGYWQLTGVPCAHALTCAEKRKWKPEDLVSPCLKKEMYKLAYERPIECTRGVEMWSDYDGPLLEPPVFKKRPGRPPKNRKKSKGEVKKVPNKKQAKLGREGIPLHCTNCKVEGHNKRTCTNRGTTSAGDERQNVDVPNASTTRPEPSAARKSKQPAASTSARTAAESLAFRKKLASTARRMNKKKTPVQPAAASSTRKRKANEPAPGDGSRDKGKKKAN